MGNDFKDLFGDWKPEDDNERREAASDASGMERRPYRALNEKEVRVINVFEGVMEQSDASAPSSPTTFVLLRDNMGRRFRIFVVRDVAYAISMALEGDTPDRPFTHDLMKSLLERLGATVERVTIDDLWQDTFYAKITIVQNERTLDIDARPSDAIALALRFRAPIYVAEAVLEATQSDS